MDGTFRNRGKRAALRSLLGDWYGSERADRESTAFCPTPRPLGELLETLVRETLDAESALGMELTSHWEEIAGAQMAQFTRVGSLRTGILYLEVLHPGYLRMLRTMMPPLLKHLQERFGPDRCTEIRLTVSAGGGRRL